MRHFARRVVAAAGLGALVCATGPLARALPPPRVDLATPTATPSPPPAGIEVLPVGSPLFLVLDDGLSSNHSHAGDVVRMHLQDALVVNGVTIAPAGTPVTMAIVSTHAAAASDNDGSVQVTLKPMPLANGRTLPIRAINEYLTIAHTAGQLATRDATDTVTDVFIPYGMLFTALRKGHDYVLHPGTVMRVLTAAKVNATDPKAIAIMTPEPLFTGGELPHADITPAPFYTQIPVLQRRPSPRPTMRPTPSPAPPVEAPSPAVSASPSAPATGTP